MLRILAHRTYRHLFMAQVVALLGTGLATVALGLLAFDLAGENAAMVLGFALTIKMVAYVLVSPIASAFANQVPRRRLLVMLDMVRAGIVLVLPFVTQVWQVYLLIFLLQSASAAFSPTFQATIPDILPDEADYTRALSLSRLAFDTENLVSPALAALVLTVAGFDTLFVGTAVGFLVSAWLIVRVTLPTPTAARPRGVYDRITRGVRIFLATPRLRGLLGLNLTVAATSSMVLVNTVAIVRGDLAMTDRDVALALGMFGAGSMLTALVLPRVLEHLSDRFVMIGASCCAVLIFGLFAAWIFAVGLSWPALLATWALTGLFYSAIMTPSGRLLRRSSHPEDRPALFAAQFALSHACWLVAYPLAGWLMTVAGSAAALMGLMALGVVGLGAALRAWPVSEPDVLPHTHPDLPLDHPHVQGDKRHAHPIVIDDLHPRWPKKTLRSLAGKRP